MKRWQWVTVWVWMWMAVLGTVETDMAGFWREIARPALGARQAEPWVCLASSVGTMALGLLSQTLLRFLAPRRDGTRASVPGASSQLFVDKPNFFDYPDSDQASLLAVAQFIGERPVTFVKTGSSPGLFQHILVGTLVVAFFLLLFQVCMHVSFQKGA